MKHTGNRFDIRHKETLMLFLRDFLQIQETGFSHAHVHGFGKMAATREGNIQNCR